LFRDVDINDYNAMMHSSKKLKTIVKWLLQHDLLQQFSLITKLLYEFWSILHLSLHLFFYLSFFSSFSTFQITLSQVA
jgi:hypothetical protein